MSIAILSTVTGNGHNSVMKSLASKFKELDYEVETFPTFYEDLMISNKILSDFYNFLMINSTQLCCKFSELSSMTRPDLSDVFYEGVKDKIVNFINENQQIECFISTSHTINHAFIRILNELKINKPFYIVITDPYNPISVGFATPGATRYFCANEVVKEILLKNKIEDKLISVTGFPINPKFLKVESKEVLRKKFGLDQDKKIIMINSGSQGIFHYMQIFKTIYANYNSNLQYIFICGKNVHLYNMLKKFSEKNMLEDILHIYGFANNIEELIQVSDIVISKAGANSFYETLHLNVPIIIDGVNGFLYQERGVIQFVDEYKLGLVLDNIENVSTVIDDMIKNYEMFKTNIEQFNLKDGSPLIVNEILSELKIFG